MRILFDSRDERFKSPFGALKESQSCRFAVHVPRTCPATGVKLILDGEDGSTAGEYPLDQVSDAGEYVRFEGKLTLPRIGLYFYYFRVITIGGGFRLFREGADRTNMEAGELWQISCVRDVPVPEDFRGRVMYQIFPDRFNRSGICDTAGKLVPFCIKKDLYSLPDHRPDEWGKINNCDFFGGNLRGIEEKLDYLSELGVGVIYLNPIFKAWSNHRYDTADYMKIDELLGTEEDFSSLCRAAHARDIKIVLDGVFNHTGSNSRSFDAKGVFGHGAVSDPQSPYRGWYDFQRWPDLYSCWWGVPTLPCVNEMNEGYLDFIIRNEDSVIAHWLRAGADGFRLDVADELPDRFIALLRERMRQVKPDAILIGEVWEDASNKISYGRRRRYFTDGELDSVMNYPWRDALTGLMTDRIGAGEFCRRIMDIRENYPERTADLLMNFISTHDTPRALSLFSPEEPPEDKNARAGYRMPSDALKVALKRMKCASFLQFVLPGMPCVYYGDEVAMQGLEDPFCRCYFRWDRVKTEPLVDHYRALGALRKRFESLRRGGLEISSRKSLVTLTRTHGGERLRATVNVGETAEIETAGDVVFSLEAGLSEGKAALKKYGAVLEILP